MTAPALREPRAARRLWASRGTAPSQDAGELPSFERIYAQYFRRVARWMRAFGVPDSESDDLAQEVFIVVRRKLDSFTGGSLPGWIYRIAQRTASDHRRRAWFRRVVLRSGASQPIPIVDTDGAFELDGTERLLGRLLERMSAVRRRAFVLFEIEGYSCAEIAELEQIPINTVYTRLHHARREFLALLSADTGQPLESVP